MEMKKEIEEQITFARNNLACRCRCLTDHLLAVIKSLESKTTHEHLCINDLGVIQSQGTIIDAECGRLGSKVEILRMILKEEKGK